MDTRILEDLGLAPAEIKCYLALLELGRTKAGQIIEHTNLPSSSVHNALHTLSKKGLISHVIVGKIKHYSAADPNAILTYIDERKRRFEEMLPALLVRKAATSSSVELYEGMRGLQTLFFTAAEHAKTGGVWRYFGATGQFRDEKLERFYRSVVLRLQERGVKVCGLHESGSTDIQNRDLIEIRTIAQSLPPDMSIYDDAVIMVSWNDPCTATLIRSRAIAQQYTKLWDELWKKSSPVAQVRTKTRNKYR